MPSAVHVINSEIRKCHKDNSYTIRFKTIYISTRGFLQEKQTGTNILIFEKVFLFS